MLLPPLCLLPSDSGGRRQAIRPAAGGIVRQLHSSILLHLAITVGAESQRHRSGQSGLAHTVVQQMSGERAALGCRCLLLHFSA